MHNVNSVQKEKKKTLVDSFLTDEESYIQQYYIKFVLWYGN